LSAGAGLPPVWTTVSAPATPNLADVLGVATAGDANNQSISNLSSLGFSNSLSIADVAGSIMSINTPMDATTGRSFQQQYLPIQVLLNVGGTPTATTVYIQVYL